MSDYLDPANEELLKDFFVEAEMQVETLESNILVLENDPKNADAIDEIFRAAHTLKGGAATVQMTELAEFTHLVEDALDELRAGRASISEGTVDTLLTSVDVVKGMLAERQNGSVYSGDTSEVEAALKTILGGGSRQKPSAAEPAVRKQKKPKAVSSESGARALTEYELLELREAAGGDEKIFEVAVRFREDNPMNTVGGIQLFAAIKQFATVLKTTPDFEALYEDVFHPEVSYYVAAKEDITAHEARLRISDVTESVTITAVEEDGSMRGARPAAPTGVAAQPSAPSTSAPPVGTVESALPEKPVAEDHTPNDAAAAFHSADTDHAAGDEERGGERGRAEQKRAGAQAGSVLRVDSRRIDNLLNLVSETVINKASFNQISNGFGDNLSSFQTIEGQYRETLKELFDSLPEYLQEIQNGESTKNVRKQINERFSDLPTLFDGFNADLKGTVAKFRNTAQNLGRIASELQEGVMRIRMVPISQIFSRFPRLVRDLSRSLKKKMTLEIEGEETELDKSVIEDLLDPLIHCVRNSIDHGIEDPAIRAEAGKPEAGTVHLRASNEGNMILIEIADDGKGIDVDAVRAKGIDRGIIHPSKQLSDVEAFNLIFDPGFSTARKVTNVSGRGVGLDVVKRQIEKLNGTVTVWSEKGVGTRFTIKIPLTLAIIQGLLVKVGKEMYAIPITSVIDS
ncbi:MAG: chemotaxis protein CheA, partial [Spirochaetales bacterium]|nr:chemotaxis protein CheA [Spirochaetales bacterium]